MTTPQEIRDKINNGDVPSFEDIKAAFPNHAGIAWHIRMAAQGSIQDAIHATIALHGPRVRWAIGYDAKATVGVGDRKDVTCISVTPGHSLTIAAIDAYRITQE